MKTRPTGSAVISTMLAAAFLVSACVVYEPVPVYGQAPAYAPAPVDRFERSWSAATAALQDQGIEIASADRTTGLIRGRRGGIDVTANLRTQSDGSVRVQFNSTGATSQDPGILDRVLRSYEARMGR